MWGARKQSPVAINDHRIPVKDQIILSADHVDVDKWRIHPRRFFAHQRKTHIIFIAFKGRTIWNDHKSGRARSKLGKHAIWVPDVLTDKYADIDAVNSHNECRVTGHKVSVFIKDAKVRKVSLYITGLHMSAMNHGGNILWPTRWGFIQITNYGNEISVTFICQLCRQRSDRLFACLAKR